MSVEKQKVWSRRALFTTEAGGRFTDTDFHAFLKQQGVVRETAPKRTEWHRFAGAPRTSLDYFNDFAGQDFGDLQAGGEDDVHPQAGAACRRGPGRRGLLRRIGGGTVEREAQVRQDAHDLPPHAETDVKTVLIVTNRPAIANSWYDDFTRFIGHQTTFKFVSESPSLDDPFAHVPRAVAPFLRSTVRMPRRRVRFPPGPQGVAVLRWRNYPKLKHIADLHWDLLVVDEAHEGVDTTKTDIAFNQIKRKPDPAPVGHAVQGARVRKGSPPGEIFNWTYEDEQTARREWVGDGQDNPYGSPPTLNLLTYQLSRMITLPPGQGVAIQGDEEPPLTRSTSTSSSAPRTTATSSTKPTSSSSSTASLTNEKYPFSTQSSGTRSRTPLDAQPRRLSEGAGAPPRRTRSSRTTPSSWPQATGAPTSPTPPPSASRRAGCGRPSPTPRPSAGRPTTLSVGQLTTGTVPEWTAVIMLSTLTSPAQYMQAAFRAQNALYL